MEKVAKQKNDKSAIIIAFLGIAITIIVSAIFIITSLSGDEHKPEDNTPTIDYTEEAFETALNNDQDVTGKIVKFKVASVHPDSVCGYNLWSGVHLNFCSDDSIDAKEGQELTVKVTSIKKSLGSYFIKYELVEK